MSENRPIIHIALPDLSVIANKQLGVSTTLDSDLNYYMYGGKDNSNNLMYFLAKDKPGKLENLKLINLDTLDSSGLVKYDSDGLLSGEGELNNLHDVTVTSPTDGNILAYDGVTSKWVNISSAGTTLDGIYSFEDDVSEPERLITVDNGSIRWHYDGLYDFNIDLTDVSGLGESSIGFRVYDASHYFKLFKSASYTYLDSDLGKIDLLADTSSQFVVSGSSEDLTLGARGYTITLNDMMDETLATSFVSESLIGSLNEIKNPARYWTSQISAADNQWRSVCYGNGLFVSVATTGTGNRVMTSPDGVNWTLQTSPADSGWYSVCYGNGLFVSVAISGGVSAQIMTSVNGRDWTLRTSPEYNSWRSVCYGNNQFVAVATDGTNRVMTSPDGITWTARSASEALQWIGVCYGDGLYVAVAIDGTNQIMTSPDGITWTSRAVPSVLQWRAVCYGNGKFVAVAKTYDGSNRSVMTSPDGITWTMQSQIVTNEWFSVTYGLGRYVAISSTGVGNCVLTSHNGIDWECRESAENLSWTSVCFGDGMYVAVSITGTGTRVMTSGFRNNDNTNQYDNIYQGLQTFMYDVDFSAEIHVDGLAYFYGSAKFTDNIAAIFGTSSDADILWNIAQTNDALYLGVDSVSRTILIGEKADKSYNRALAAQSDPTLAIFSSAQSTNEYHLFSHNGVDAYTEIGKGGLTINSDGPIVLADDAYFDLPASSAGWGIFTCGGDGIVRTIIITWNNVASVYNIIDAGGGSSQGFVLTDTDGKFCFFDNGTSVRVRNRTGLPISVVFTYQYTTNPTGEMPTPS